MAENHQFSHGRSVGIESRGFIFGSTLAWRLGTTMGDPITEQFLGQCLGGRVEPIGGTLKPSTIPVPHGAEFIPGLKRAIDSC